MRVIITGTTGWLGGSLAAALVAAGHSVVGVARRPTTIAGVESVQADISDGAAVSALFAELDFDVVVHMAATLGRCSMDQAIGVNVQGTHKVLEACTAACRTKGKKCKIVVASSVAAIGTCAPHWPPTEVPVPATHGNVLGPWPYALSKSQNEEYCKVLATLPENADIDLDVIALRVGNVVTAPPDIVHHDGQGVEYPVKGATSSDVTDQLAVAEKAGDVSGNTIFPEAPLSSIALPDIVSCLVACATASHVPGFRQIAAVGPTSYSSEPVAELFKSWYGDKAPDCSHYLRAGHERDAIFDLEPAFAAVGWRPKYDLNCGTSLPKPCAVYLVIEKKVPVASRKAWVATARALAESTRQEDGCLFYDFARFSGEEFVILEKWASEAHLAAHAASPHFVQHVPAMDAISETTNFTKASDAVLAAKPLEAPAARSQAAKFLHIKKLVTAEHKTAWLAMATALANATRAEKGCVYYEFLECEPGVFRIVECWASQPHLDAHAASAHFCDLVPKMDAISETASFAIGDDALATPKGPRVGKILILYDSSTACTAQMATFIAEGALLLDRTVVRVRKVSGVVNHWDDIPKLTAMDKVPEATFEDIVWCDGMACGSPTNLGCVSWRMKKFWDDFSQAGHWSQVDGRVGLSFASQGAHAGGGEVVCQALNAIMLNFGFAVVGVTDYVDSMHTLHYGAVCAKAPRAVVDQMSCRRLGLRLAEFVGLYCLHRPETHPLLCSKRRDAIAWDGSPVPPRGADPAKLLRLNTQRCDFGSAQDDPRPTCLVFTKMAAYVHDATPAAAHFLAQLAADKGFKATVSSDSSMLEQPSVTFDVIVLVNTSGDAFDLTKEQLTSHVAAGRGVLGVHACLASFLDGEDAVGGTRLGSKTSLIADVFGTHFVNHPPPQTGTVKVCAATLQSAFGGKLADSCAAQLPETLETYDEFFNYDRALPADARVLARLDETTYEGGSMGADHPIVWCLERGTAPIFYCGLGHFDHAYSPGEEGRADFGVARNFLRAGFDFVAKI